jgi:hypothetical protein
MGQRAQNNAIKLAATGTTGTGRFSAEDFWPAKRIAVEFVVEAVGATPTATFTIQGLKVGGDAATASDWADIAYVEGDSTVAASKAGITVTTVSRTVKFIDGLDKRFFESIAVNVSANTNVTFRANAYPTSF